MADYSKPKAATEPVATKSVTPSTIWNSQQNHPELVVQDAREAFDLSEEQCEQLRFIMMNRGVNKWLYARLLFIDLKHDIKDMLKQATPKTERYYLLQEINIRMQGIAKMQRWVEWGTHRHNKMANNRKDIILKGRPT